jgi:hypothetical protein
MTNWRQTNQLQMYITFLSIEDGMMHSIQNRIKDDELISIDRQIQHHSDVHAFSAPPPLMETPRRKREGGRKTKREREGGGGGFYQVASSDSTHFFCFLHPPLCFRFVAASVLQYCCTAVLLPYTPSTY